MVLPRSIIAFFHLLPSITKIISEQRWIWACILGFSGGPEAMTQKKIPREIWLLSCEFFLLQSQTNIIQIDNSSLWSFIGLRLSYSDTTQSFSITKLLSFTLIKKKKRRERERKRQRIKQNENLDCNSSYASPWQVVWPWASHLIILGLSNLIFVIVQFSVGNQTRW